MKKCYVETLQTSSWLQENNQNCIFEEQVFSLQVCGALDKIVSLPQC